jgi:hypothetical protein
MTRVKYLSQVFIVIILSSLQLNGETIIAGGNIINQTWTAAGSPYIVQGDITIPSGSILTIEPGVIVKFATSDNLFSGINSLKCELTIQNNGTLFVQGTAISYITFTSNSTTPTVGDWYGLVVNSGGICNIDYCYMEYCILPESPGPISGPETICKVADNITYEILPITNATSYLWTLPTGASGTSTTSSISVTFSSDAISGNIKVKGHNAYGYGIESNISILVNETPQAPVITLNDGVLLSNAINGNQWYFNNNPISDATNVTYTPTQDGDYYVITTINGCSSNSSNLISFVATQIEKNITKNEILTISNPTSDFVRINLSKELDSNYKVEIYANTGSLLQRINYEKETTGFVLDLRSYPPGIYIVTLYSTTSFFQKKIIKE